MKRFVVEGRYKDPEDGGITGDWLLAPDSDSAGEEAGAARRENCNGWELDRVLTFADYISEQLDTVRQMASMTDEDVERSWRETKANLLGGEQSGLCLKCGRQTSPEGICRRCSLVEELLDLVGNDIFTDAPEYAERVERIHEVATELTALESQPA